jgi:hypothetical protein
MSLDIVAVVDDRPGRKQGAFFEAVEGRSGQAPPRGILSPRAV